MSRKNYDPANRRDGKIATAVFHAILLFLFFIVGIKYMDPLPEEGIAINFGYDADGFGNSESAPTETANTQPNPTTQPQEEAVETPAEELVTQELEEAPAIAPKTAPTPKKPDPVKPVENPTPTPTPTPKPSNALQNALKSSQSGKGSGEGETKGNGDQGDPNGDPNSASRTGGSSGSGTSGAGPGGGGTGNYLLGNRQALQRPKPDYGCPEQGRVVVAVFVNRQGEVVEAIPGERIPGGASSNTSSQCLYAKAKEAALKTKWQGDASAVERQKGYIIYDFGKQ